MTKDQETQNRSDDLLVMGCVVGCRGLTLQKITVTCAIDLGRGQRSVQRLSRKHLIVFTSGWQATKSGKDWHATQAQAPTPEVQTS